MSLTDERFEVLDRRQFFIGGEWVDPTTSQVREQTEAATAETIAIAAIGVESDIDAAVKSARRAFDEGPWGRSTSAERAAALRRARSRFR